MLDTILAPKFFCADCGQPLAVEITTPFNTGRVQVSVTPCKYCLASSYNSGYDERLQEETD